MDSLTRCPPRSRRVMLVSGVAALAAAAPLSAAVGAPAAQAHERPILRPGNLLVSRTVYTADPGDIVAGTTLLPPGCVTGCVAATSDASYPGVWNNEAVDPSFGVTSPIYLDQLTPDGHLVNSLAVPDSSASRGREHDAAGGLVTSFPSKSELALNLSTDGRFVTFMGYVAPPATLDVSNSNTPAVFDPTNPVPGSYYRAVAQLGADGHVTITETNAYSGNNGRAAILNNSHGSAVYYTAGNAGNGGSPEPAGVIVGAGAQLLRPSWLPERAQHPGAPTPVGSFNISQLGLATDKIGKDTNFRGLTIFGNVVYLTKGSGGNGVNTVYFVDTTGHACPNGIGEPQPGAALPTSPIAYDPTTVQAEGLPSNMCILAGFPTAVKSKVAFPFGVWFANADTLYVTDEGNGDASYSSATASYTAAAAQSSAGLQKWVKAGGVWHLAYTLQSGLSLGAPYTVPGYPTGSNPTTGLPWAPATDGLRNLTGRVNPDGTVTVWAVTSTVSGGTDTGADPNQLVAITDRLDAVALPSPEQFHTVRSAAAGQALRGVSLTPSGDRDR